MLSHKVPSAFFYPVPFPPLTIVLVQPFSHPPFSPGQFRKSDAFTYILTRFFAQLLSFFALSPAHNFSPKPVRTACYHCHPLRILHAPCLWLCNSLCTLYKYTLVLPHGFYNLSQSFLLFCKFAKLLYSALSSSFPLY